MTKICSVIFLLVIALETFADDKNAAKDLVVMIATSSNAIGSGIIVGEDEEWVYVATAAHVVWNESETKLFELEVIFRTLPNKVFSAQLANPLNRSAMSSTPISVDINNDFAVLKIKKNKENKYPTIAISRVIRGISVSKVQYIGRKSFEQTWRGSPLSEVVDKASLPDRYKDHITSRTFYNLEGYSGGGVFSADWKIVGMTVKGGVLSNSTKAEKLTSALSIDWVKSKLESLSIPLSTYLKDAEEGQLDPETVMNQMPNIIPMVMHFGKNAQLAINAFVVNKPIKNIQLNIYLKEKNKPWYLFNEKKFDASFGNNGGILLTDLPSQTTDLFVCHTNKLANGGTGVGRAAILNFSLPLPATEMLTVSHAKYKEYPSLYATNSNPCATAMEKEGIRVKE